MIVVLLQAGFPDRAVVPGAFDSCMLCCIVMSSFTGQMLLNRSFQIQSAAKGSSINCMQVQHALNTLPSFAVRLKL